MNILILSKKIPYPPHDGEAIATLNMALGLAASGHSVWLQTMNTSKHSTSPEEIPEPVRSKINLLIINVNTKIRIVKLITNLIFSRSPYNAVRFRSEKYLQSLDKLLESQTFDIIQTEGPYLDYCIPLIRMKSTGKIVFRAHNMEYLIWERRSEAASNFITRYYLKLLGRRIKNLEKKMLDKVDALVPISETDLKGFISMGLSVPYHICQAGIELSKYTPADPPAETTLFFIGSLDWGPNTEGLNWFFKNVWPGIIKKHPQLHLYLAGRNPHHYLNNIKSYERVTHCGEIEDALQFMRDHSIMIVPLFSGSGIRIKILEGLAMKKTIITTSIGTEGISVTHQQNILLADTGAEFTNWIDTLLANPGMLRKLGNNARKFVTENFDNLVLSKKLTDFYKEKIL